MFGALQDILDLFQLIDPFIHLHWVRGPSKVCGTEDGQNGSYWYLVEEYISGNEGVGLSQLFFFFFLFLS